MRKRNLEDEFQKQVAKHLWHQYPSLLWWHTPNGGKRTKAQAGIFKAMGVRAGVADIVLFWLEGIETCMAAIELKVGKNNLEDSQKQFRNDWLNAGGHYAICRDLDEVIEWLRIWGVPKNVQKVGVM